MSDWAKFAAEILRTAAPDQHAGKALLGAAAAKRLVTPPYERGRYAGGWSVYHNRVYGNVLSHDGSNTLNHASALLVPGKRFAILVATNTGHRLAKQACSLVQYRIAADWLFGGMDSASLSREPYRANNVRQWIARIQNNLIDRSRRYLTTELYEFLTSDEGRELKETLAKQGAFQRIQFVARQKEDGAEFGIYRVTFERAEWLVEYEADTRRVTQRLRFRMISPARR